MPYAPHTRPKRMNMSEQTPPKAIDAITDKIVGAFLTLIEDLRKLRLDRNAAGVEAAPGIEKCEALKRRDDWKGKFDGAGDHIKHLNIEHRSKLATLQKELEDAIRERARAHGERAIAFVQRDDARRGRDQLQNVLTAAGNSRVEIEHQRDAARAQRDKLLAACERRLASAMTDLPHVECWCAVCEMYQSIKFAKGTP